MVNGVEWKITSVKHKYLHVLHRRMEQFERHFPESGAIHMINIKTEDGATNLEPLTEKLREQHEYTERVFDHYLGSGIPLSCFAELQGRDVIDAWYGLAQSGRNFKVCHGNPHERQAASGKRQ